MAFTQCVPTQALVDIAAGVHADGDTYKCALYTKANATGMDATATTYNSTGELTSTGTGYTAGGVVVARTATAANGGKAIITFANPTFANLTTGSNVVDGYVIYNASKSNKILKIGTLATALQATAGTGTITMPTADAANGFIVIG